MVPRLKTALIGPLPELEQRILDRMPEEIEALHTVPPAAVAATAATV